MKNMGYAIKQRDGDTHDVTHNGKHVGTVMSYVDRVPRGKKFELMKSANRWSASPNGGRTTQGYRTKKGALNAIKSHHGVASGDQEVIQNLVRGAGKHEDTTPKRVKGSRTHANGIEIRPMERGDGAKAYTLHKNGVHIGHVHEFTHRTTHRVSGQVHASHRTQKTRVKLHIKPEHLSPGRGAGSVTGFKNIKDAVEHAGYASKD